MRNTRSISIVVCLLAVFFFANTTFALLEDNLDGTVTQTRNDGSMLMWLKDANYAATSGYDANGRMTWYEANDWIGTLNSSNYLGYTDWRLPQILPVNGSNYNYEYRYDGASDWGFNVSAPGTVYEGSTASEMAYMYYIELSNLGIYSPDGSFPQPGWGLNNTALFTNIQPANYWSSNTYSPEDPNIAWEFEFFNGQQTRDPKFYNDYAYAWAARDVAVIAEPISSILFITGGSLLAGRRYLKKRKNT